MPSTQSRRHFLKTIGGAGASLQFVSLSAPETQKRPQPSETEAAAFAEDQNYWNQIASQYDVERSVTNLENAYWGIMARPVAAAYIERIRFVNRVNVVYVRDAYASALFSKDLENVRVEIARELGCSAAEIALTRSGTEALQNLIVNYSKLSPGDSVLYADLDFDAMQFAMDFVAHRRGANVVRLNIPEPASRANILETYDHVLRNSIRPKLLLLTHISHRTGIVIPVAEIAAMARNQGVDTVVDAAQSWGQLDFKISDLNADFVGFSLHKWIGAPLGTGCLYIKASRLSDVDPHFDNRDWPRDDIRSRVLMGSSNFAAFLTVPDALAFHRSIGPAHKEARLRYLRDYWVHRTQQIRNIQIITPDDPTLHAGITAFRFNQGSPNMAPIFLQKVLATKYGVLTAARKGIAKGDAIRVTPGLYNLEADLDQFIRALQDLTAVRHP